MRPEFRYFKCALSVEPIKSLDEKWRKIERSESFGGDKFPEIPEYLTEIKQSEFLALQGK